MEIILLAIALSMDSAALSIANGAKCGNLNLFKITKIAFIYGFSTEFSNDPFTETSPSLHTPAFTAFDI